MDNINFINRHIKAISKAAQTEDQLIVFREVNEASLKWKDKGINIIDKNGNIIHKNAAAKDMGVKAKSANTGKFSGLIPKNPVYSKMGDKFLAEKDGNKKLALHQKLRKAALKTEKAIQNGEVTVVTAVVDGEEMEVLADQNGRPHTADYDMLCNTTHKDNKNENDILYFDDDMGNTTKETSSLIMEINLNILDEDKKAGLVDKNAIKKCIDDYKNEKTAIEVAHGSDSANPGAEKIEITEKNPFTVFTPKGEVKLIKSNDELVNLADEWSKKGYKLPANKSWEIDFKENTVEYIDLNAKNKSSNNNDSFIQSRIWNREKQRIKKQINISSDTTEHKGKRRTSLLILELLDRAYKKEKSGDKVLAKRFKERALLIEDLYNKRNNNEMSPAIKSESKRKITEYHKVANIKKSQKELPYAAATIVTDKNALRILKASVKKSTFKQIIQTAAKHKDYSQSVSPYAKKQPVYKNIEKADLKLADNAKDIMEFVKVFNREIKSR